MNSRARKAGSERSERMALSPTRSEAKRYYHHQQYYKERNLPTSMKKPSRNILFSTFLRNRLDQLNITPHEFGLRVGLRNTARARKWIDGTEMPPFSRVIAIAHTLDADPIEVSLLWMGQPIPDPV
jgi:hypothetical protein